MRVPFVDLRRYACIAELTAVQEVVKRGWFLGGEEVAAFEDAFAKYTGAAQSIAVANGTDAIEIALRAAGIGAGDEVATVANAGMYSTTAIRAAGAIPVYIDVEAETLLMSPESLAASVGPATRAAIVTHLYGRMAAMPEILRVADRYGLVTIEDCAHAHGARLDGRPAGSWGTAAAFSFYPTKNLGAYGDAGAVVTSDRAIAERARRLREYGWSERFRSVVAGGCNSRMDEIQAAVLRVRLHELDGLNQRRRQIAMEYVNGLALSPLVRPVGRFDDACVAHLFVVRSERRDSLTEWLASCGVQSSVHYPIPDHRQQSQAGLPCRFVTLENTERAVREIVSLPCYPGLREDELAYVLTCIERWTP